MKTAEELLKNYAHGPTEFPVLAEQTHKLLRDGKIVNEKSTSTKISSII